MITDLEISLKVAARLRLRFLGTVKKKKKSSKREWDRLVPQSLYYWVLGFFTENRNMNGSGTSTGLGRSFLEDSWGKMAEKLMERGFLGGKGIKYCLQIRVQDLLKWHLDGFFGVLYWRNQLNKY